MSTRTRYCVVSWVNQTRSRRSGDSRAQEYGTASTKQAAIRLAERVLPPDAEYIVTTIHTTVHTRRTPPPARRQR